MSYSICLIDDDIPADKLAGIRDNELLDASSLQLILNQVDPWPTLVIKYLIQLLLDQKENGVGTINKWSVTACTHPSFYLQHLSKETTRSEILIYDWDYPGSTSEINAESALLKILQSTYCLVFIFSGAGMKTQIDVVLKKPEFKPYENRIYYLDKDQEGEEQSAFLLTKAEENYNNNFSFLFARGLRKLATDTIDSILVDMGQASLSDISNHIGSRDSTGKKDFVDFLSERFRATIANDELYTLIDVLPPRGGNPIPDLAAKIWSNRLYFNQSTDTHVRKGDIIKIGEAIFLVISADCDLARFWKKNLGIVNCIELFRFEHSNELLRDWLAECNELSKIRKNNKEVRSLLAQIQSLSEGPFIFPYVPNGETEINLFAIPKSIQSFKPSNKPDDWTELGIVKKGDERLKYTHWPGPSKICTVSEPFLTPAIEHILNNIRGYGVPDYDESTEELVGGLIDDFCKEPVEVKRTK